MPGNNDMQLKRILPDRKGEHRVAIYRREDGLFTYRIEAYHAHPDEPDDELLWYPGDEQEGGLFDSEENAVRDACQAVPWLRELGKEQGIADSAK